MHLVFWIGLLALVPSGIAVAAPARTITKSEIRSDPPDVTDRRLKDVVWSLFEKQDLRSRKDPTRPLSRLFLRTKTRATGVANLCRYDSMGIEFEPLNPKDEGPDAPVRPVGLTSSSHFAFLSAPAAEHDDTVQDGPASAARCSRLPAQSFFTAKDEELANNGFRAWLALLDSVRSGRKFPLECDLAAFETRPCEVVISALKPEQLWDVETCDSEIGKLCYRLNAGDRLITVVTTGYVHPGPPAGQIVGAKLESMIVMAHEIID